jgi:membrane protein
MFAYFRAPVGPVELAKRTVRAALADNVFNLAAQLGFYFFLGVFPALMVLVSLISLLPLQNVLPPLLDLLGEFAPTEVVELLSQRLQETNRGGRGGILTFGILVAFWSSSTALVAVITTLNRAYNLEESRPFWKQRLVALLLTLGTAFFIVTSLLVIVLGPMVAGILTDWVGLGEVWATAWTIVRWPLAIALVILGVDLIYYFAPNAEQEWVWITPGAVVATLLWIAGSAGFNYYMGRFGDFDATYGALGGVVVLLMWFYLTGLAVLIGAELNAEIDKASEHGDEIRRPAEHGKRKKIGAAAERDHREKATARSRSA